MDVKVITKVARTVRADLKANRIYKKSEINRSDLRCACALAAGEIWKRLQQIGVQARIAVRNYQSCCHCFVVVEDHIVDITATQFKSDMRPIEILPLEEAKQKYKFWKPSKIHDNLRSFIKHLRKSQWPDDQIPNE